MSEPSQFELHDFSGTARLFPLPNLVMFPGALQLLHIFEPRYRQMVAEALEGDRLIGMTLLAPGWEQTYDQCPPIHTVGCLGRITTCQQLADGRYNLLLHGLRRFRLLEELPPERSFRQARVELLSDEYRPGQNVEATRHVLIEAFRSLLEDAEALDQQVELLREKNVPLGTLADVIAYTCNAEVEVKQELLAELDVDRRCQRLLGELRAQGATIDPSMLEPGIDPLGRRPFPPDFSDN